jgi:hypothetical protein
MHSVHPTYCRRRLRRNRLFDQIESIPLSLRSSHPAAPTLALEGTELIQTLYQWHRDYLENPSSDTVYTRLAQIDYHALMLFLCQAYGYYACWDGLPIPSLACEDVENHVKSILDLAEDIQTAPHVPGILLLFALRMASVHAIDETLMWTVEERLKTIYWKGFVVSWRVESDLRELWESRRRSGYGSSVY